MQLSEKLAISEVVRTARYSKGGRPTKYKPAYCNLIIDYFRRDHTVQKTISHTNKRGETWTVCREVANRLPTIEEFSGLVGISKQTLHNWTRQHPDFQHAYTMAKQFYAAFVIDLAARGFLNSTFAIFLAKNTMGWHD